MNAPLNSPLDSPLNAPMPPSATAPPTTPAVAAGLTPAPLITRVESSPTWRLLRSRLGSRHDLALVFQAANGEDRLEPPRGGDVWGYPRPALRDVRRGLFTAVLSVSLAERSCWIEVPARRPAPSSAGGGPPHRYGVAFRITNPVVAARAGLTAHAAEQLIARHIGDRASVPGALDPLRQPPPRYGTAQVLPPGQEQAIDGAGLAYWFLDPPAGLLAAAAADAGPSLPPVFGEAHREAYRFYREVVAGGPADLAAFWLLQHPDQAREVLDWTVAHRDLLTDRDGWERALAATLQGLTREDRGYVGANLAHLLSDIGVPQGEEVLRRIGHDASSAPGHTG
ncbi:hypothetical protein [Streptomyces sp. NPDC002328]|uniref:hypothetical protein n=1 Tax=Streptomyces sp. NPDC002328 TaxID=3364642 RepID=UPI0036A8F871